MDQRPIVRTIKHLENIGIHFSDLALLSGFLDMKLKAHVTKKDTMDFVKIKILVALRSQSRKWRHPTG